MRYVILSVFILFTSSLYANECTREIKLVLNDNDALIDSQIYKHYSKGKESKESKENKHVYSFSFLYIDGKLYTTAMKAVTSISSVWVDESGNEFDLENLILNSQGTIITPRSQFKSTNFYEENRIFTYDIFVSVDHSCTLDAYAQFRISKFEKQGSSYKLIPDSAKWIL